ncbi:serine hydrolase [Rapidithrix thailandica]|uniref:Serine hydrolase n=1 Tax=Rapidithrix thailandica TaxID=413964 RepID=A0AAW9SAU4_9BACT
MILFIALSLLLALCLVFLYIFFRLGPILTAFVAKVYASCVFTSRRNPASVSQGELALVPFVNVNIDKEARKVTASLGGFFSKTAVYKPGTGCSLLLGSKEEDVTKNCLDKDQFFTTPPQQLRLHAKEQDHVVNLRQLEQAFDYAFHQPKKVNTRAFLVFHHSTLVMEKYAEGFDAQLPQAGWSMCKSVINALVGILVKQGRLDIHAPVNLWPSGDLRNQLTIHQLLQMSSGLGFKEKYLGRTDVTQMLFDSPSVADFVLKKPLKYPPGTFWDYTSGTTNIISFKLREILGASYHNFPYQELFAKTGMHSAEMECDANGLYVGSSFMFASAHDWARFGLLYANDGVWEGERILPEGWVDYSRQPNPAAEMGRYGAHFWLNAGEKDHPEKRFWPSLPNDLYYASGFEGQFVMVIPSHSLLIVRLGQTLRKEDYDMEGVINKVLKAFKD